MWFYSYYTPVLLLQAFCLYHAFRNGNEQRWFFLIVFLPLLGSLIYLYYHFSGNLDMGQLAEGVKGAVNSNYAIQKLEKELAFSDTIANRTRLADAYLDAGRYSEAIESYQSCLTGANANDPDIMRKLVYAYYKQGDSASAVAYGQQLGQVKEFKNSEERVAYAWSLFLENKVDAAQQEFEALDQPYSNFPHRYEYARFLLKLGENAAAKAKLQELIREYEQADGLERKLKRATYQQVRKLAAQI